MTRLPLESWEVAPRLDLEPYEINTVCPVTGETSGLENHHIWRRSFTGKDSKELYWVEGPDGTIYPNRVALSQDAHHRITTNRARLEFRGHDLWYLEGGEEKRLDLRFRLLSGEEKVAAPKPRRTKREPSKPKAVWSMRLPSSAEENGIEVWETLLDQFREKYKNELGWKDDVPAYYVAVSALYKALTS